jgi:hypothetical protein
VAFRQHNNVNAKTIFVTIPESEAPMNLLPGEKSVLSEPQKLGVGEQGSVLKEADRVNLYRQYFVEHASNAPAPNAFIQQVDGYGVQVFAQASSFAVR